MNFVSGSSSNQQVARYTKKQTRGIFYPSPACEKLPVNSPFSFAQQRGTKASMLVSRNARRFQNLTALSPICFHRAAGRNGTASQFYKAAPFSSIPPSRFDASLNLYLAYTPFSNGETAYILRQSVCQLNQTVGSRLNRGGDHSKMASMNKILRFRPFCSACMDIRVFYPYDFVTSIYLNISCKRG